MKNVLTKLENVTTEKELYSLFKDEKFPNSGNSNFFDRSISLVATGGILTNYEVKVEGIPGFYIRLLLFLKLSGLMGNIPKGNGQYSYFGYLHSFMYTVTNYSNIKRIDDIDSNIVDKYIIDNVDIEKFTSTHIRKKILTFTEYLSFNIKLPFFLQVNEQILESVRFKQLVSDGKKEAVEKINGVGLRKTYPLVDLKIIISDSINYIESHSNDCLEAARIYKKIQNLNSELKYRTIYKVFMETEIQFEEPILKKIQKKVLLSKTKYLNAGNGKNLGRSINEIPVNSLHRCVEQLEVSCVAVILLMTGMRVGELTMLDRNIEISHDEHYYLDRIVYKTAETADGESLSMPVPLICKKALEILSELAYIKDGKKTGSIILTALEYKNVQSVRPIRINQLLIRYCERLNLDPITPHQFRHAMAFLIVHINESDGLELARMFLGHSSIIMTLQYMAYYNNEIKDAIDELTKEESIYFVEKITKYVYEKKKIFGYKGERLMPNHKFAGQQVEDFVKLMRKGLLKLIEEEKLAIIQTPVSLCMHDLSKYEDLSCQRGFNIKDIVANGPAPSRCKGANCANALFFEEHIEKLKDNMYADIEPSLKERLEKNTYFMEAGGFEQDPYRKVIKDYDNYKKTGS
ncbi:tyrosine-type recombinase/integrase [Arcobacter roscoffensis]|uniref:Tyrosine-type recombinase/integrase n=1 Tax=Arcobacter roscoffensis TaxID=2961520 RepID=A0ABY5E7E7_9BACT|nr:tyrosine-type recombinase/integrase [Arcobacter roscoffensis]UTJ07105.1 tyrosine-type recombinase/integrase [Arcobacter roscoffensis]